MKSINGIDWKDNKIPERYILKNKQNYDISYLLSKIFLEKNYTEEEINNSIYKNYNQEISFKNQDLIHAANFLIECINNKGKVLIFGDYDVDGYLSTYLLFDYFTNLKIDCDYYIPDRFLDGYGPNIPLLKKLLNKKNFDLIIFVDCGTNSFDEINYLESQGIKTIIIDHHQIHEHKNFKKSIIINPLKNKSLKKYSLFCATTLVYFFIKYLFNIINAKKKIDLNKYLFFSAIATICDQMPLRDLNKLIVINGFNNFNIYKSNNLKKLIKINRKLTSTDVGFSLGPILNSASRLSYSNLPLKLLIEKNNTNIDKISKKLIYLNEKRKKIQNSTIYFLNKDLDLKNSEIIFKYKENINEGLLGIIASNFVELYNKPSFVLTNSNNLIKCSSRSVYNYNIGNILYLALKKKIIINGGGHAMAGGCTLKKEKLNEFKNFLNVYYNSKIDYSKNLKFYTSEQDISSLLTFAKYEMQFLEPLGNNNISPFFLLKNIKIIKFKIIKNLHLHLIIKSKSYKSCVCFAFNAIGTKLGDLLMNNKKEIDLIVQINNKIIQKNSDFNLIIKDAIL